VQIWSRSIRAWDGFYAFSFSVSACFVCWALSFAASLGPGVQVTILPLQFTINTNSILMAASSFLPAFYCFVTYPECRSSLWRVDANWKVYAAAVATGLCLPFTSYLGTHNPAFPWGRLVANQLVAAFAVNFFLGPFWEEIVWRGCFLNKIRPLASSSSSILLMSAGWTLWHGGYIALNYRKGHTISWLIVFVLIVFFMGVLFGSLFELGRGSIWPSVLAHSSFDAGAVIYYSKDNRTFELGSYVAELIFVATAAGILFRAAILKSSISASAANGG